jgi:hypothetical protein
MDLRKADGAVIGVAVASYFVVSLCVSVSRNESEDARERAPVTPSLAPGD